MKLATHCLKLVVHQSEPYHYYMAVCEYKKGNYLTSLEHLKNEKLLEKYVSSYSIGTLTFSRFFTLGNIILNPSYYHY